MFEYPTLTVYYSRSIRSYTNVNKSAPKSAKYVCYDNTNGSFSDYEQIFPKISNKIPGLVKKLSHWLGENSLVQESTINNIFDNRDRNKN